MQVLIEVLLSWVCEETMATGVWEGGRKEGRKSRMDPSVLRTLI